MLWVKQTLDQYLASSHMELCVFVTFSLKCLCRERLNQVADKQTAEQMEGRVWISASPWFTGSLRQISLSPVSLVGFGVGWWRPVASETVDCTERWAVRDLFWSDNWYQMVYDTGMMHVAVCKVCRVKKRDLPFKLAWSDKNCGASSVHLWKTPKVSLSLMFIILKCLT